MKNLFLLIVASFLFSEVFSQELNGKELALLGITLYNEGDMQGSISAFTQAIEKLNPKLSPTILMLCYSYRGQAKNDLDDTRGAVADLTKSIGYAN